MAGTVETNKRTEFMTLEFDTENSVLNTLWSPETESMTDEEYMEVFQNLSNSIRNHKIKYWLGDTRAFKKTVSPELQEWYAKEIMPELIEAGLEKIALIAPEEFIAGLSVEQSIDEILMANGNKLTIQYFDNMQEARDWVS